MKKTYYFLFSLICLFCCNIVFAENEITIDSMIPVYDENSGVIVKEENGLHSVVFNDKDQQVEYNIVLKNNTDKDIPIDNLSLPTPTEDFLKYELTGLNSGDILKANSTKDIVISLETIKTEGWGRNFNIDLTAAVNLDSSVLNPNTSDFVVILFILLIVFGGSVIVLKNKRLARYGVLIIGFFSVIPYINADKEYIVPIKINVSYESQNVMKASECEYDGEYSETWKCVDYWVHFQRIENFYIENEISNIEEYEYKFDVSQEQNGKVTAYLVKNESALDYYDLYLQADGIIYFNEDSSFYFAEARNLQKIVNLQGVDTSKVTDMSYMFWNIGLYVDNLELDIEFLDTSNVTNMSYMFMNYGPNSDVINLNLSNFDTSNVTDMTGMFSGAGNNNKTFILDISSFNTSNVTNMTHMFSGSGYNALDCNLDVSNFDTSKVTNMSYMFSSTGYNNPNFTLDVSNFDTSNVTNMEGMFTNAGYSNPNFTLDVSNFDTSNVTDMSSMFTGTGYNSTNLTLDLSNFDTSNVTDMSYMFWDTGRNSTSFILDVSNFNTSNVTNMKGMFTEAGYSNPNFTLDVSNFDTSNVTDMREMFLKTGYNSAKLNTTITIKNPNTISYTQMFTNVATKSGSKITVNYTNETSALVDKMIATKSEGANVVKGVQIN